MSAKYNLAEVIKCFLRGYVLAKQAHKEERGSCLQEIYVGVIDRFNVWSDASRFEKSAFSSGTSFLLSQEDCSGRRWIWKDGLILFIDQFQVRGYGPHLALAAFADDSSRDMTMYVNNLVDDCGTNFYSVETGIQCQGKAIARNDFGKITFFDNCA